MSSRDAISTIQEFASFLKQKIDHKFIFPKLATNGSENSRKDRKTSRRKSKKEKQIKRICIIRVYLTMSTIHLVTFVIAIITLARFLLGIVVISFHFVHRKHNAMWKSQIQIRHNFRLPSGLKISYYYVPLNIRIFVSMLPGLLPPNHMMMMSTMMPSSLLRRLIVVVMMSVW